jgi:hypothetical protein
MLYGKSLVRKTPIEIGDEIGKLLGFWEPAFAKLNWHDRLQLLEQIDEEIQRDWRQDPGSGAISAEFTASLIDRLGRGAILCRDQADFYLNSSSAADRDAASAWYGQHRSNGAVVHAATEQGNERTHLPDRSRGPLPT